MDLIREVYLLIWCFCVLFSTKCALAALRSEKPNIVSEFETIVEANANHSVFCQGNRPLKWTTPIVPEENRSWTTFHIQKERPINRTYQYGLRLNIINMSYPFVGFYYCHYEGSDTHHEDDSSKIYLYVNDPDHLTLLATGDDILPVTVTQFEEVTLPCKPTSPDIKVSLETFDGTEDVKIGTTVNGVYYGYNSLYGFITNDTESPHDIKILYCIFERNNRRQRSLVRINVEIPVSHLRRPYIKDWNDGHTIIGNALALECIIKSENTVNFHWKTPSGPVDKHKMEKRMNLTTPQRDEDKYKQILTIYNTTSKDNGTYYCKVTDNQNHSSSTDKIVRIYDVNENYLEVEEENQVYSLIATAGDPSVQWSIKVNGHPIPKVIWLDNKNNTIRMEVGSKYEAYFNSSSDSAFLKIKDISITDFGNYTLLASNNKTEKTLSLFLNVTDKPSVVIEIKPFNGINEESTVICLAYAYPEPEFQWYFKPCQFGNCNYTPVNGTVTKSKGFEFISEIKINSSESGYVKCYAENYKGYAVAVKGFYVSDINNGFDIFGMDSSVDVDEKKGTATIAEGETITAICGASTSNYSDVTWFINDKQLKNNDKYRISKSYTKYSTKVQLEMLRLNKSDSGKYSCRVTDTWNGDYLFKNLTFIVANPMKPNINSTMKGKLEMNIPDKLVLQCKVSGVPKPELTWYKNGAVFVAPQSKRIQFFENNEKIVFSATKEEDEGTYKCLARNNIGYEFREQVIKFKNLPRAELWLKIVIILLALACAGAVIFLIIKIRKERKLQRDLKLLGLANFEKGAVENINPELGVDDQAELLPYDQKWEFPIERLKLGKQLGSGAFGVVMKGVAKNIVDEEPETTVAVKMVKKNADHTYIKALASELKIMVHLGKHLNVVNLLGACTKNVAKRELLVIVEFCRYGNIQNYLLRHRDNYIDQVDPKTGRIDYVIGQDFFDRTYSVSSDRSTRSPSLKYAALTFPNSSDKTTLPPANNMGDYRANANTEMSTATDMTTVSQGEDGVILSNNSVQPEWRSNYRGDYKGNVKPICTKDLLAWTFQVARGMDYLASRKVLHGDLAARNILLADNNIVKICDFGLAKSMYKNDNYKKRGDGPLPVKWMAIESIRDRVFSTQSDVWSFGIVLWEFFSLARTPYPGMAADERLYQKLVDGYRMESPPYAPKEVYKMMTDCWSAKPLARPSFTKLTERIGSLLEETTRKHYIDLNDPYLVMNTQRLEEGQSDYLAMLSPPTFEVLSSPHYVNEMVGQESLEDSGYLSMKPNTIFSPRVEDGPMFDFNVNNRKDLNSEEGNKMELLPMLRRASDSGCETPTQSPTTPNSFSNPSYHIPPKIEEEGNEQNKNYNTNLLLNSGDNYVNMPQNKSVRFTEKSKNENNPFIDSGSEKGNNHYVNNTSKDWESIKA